MAKKKKKRQPMTADVRIGQWFYLVANANRTYTRVTVSFRVQDYPATNDSVFALCRETHEVEALGSEEPVVLMFP